VVTTGSRPVPREAVREAVTMALYVVVVLAAEFVAVEEHAVDEPSTVAVIGGSALGVALAHLFAFNLAARLGLTDHVPGWRTRVPRGDRAMIPAEREAGSELTQGTSVE
jgi:ribosomal protein S12